MDSFDSGIVRKVKRACPIAATASHSPSNALFVSSAQLLQTLQNLLLPKLNRYSFETTGSQSINSQIIQTNLWKNETSKRNEFSC